MISQQVTGNIGMYYAAYRLSRKGWNVMPTSRNARGIDLLIYDTRGHYKGIQVKALSKHGAIPLGIKGVDNLLGDWWIIVTEVANEACDPKCFIMTPNEVKKRAVRDEHKARAYWLPAKQYQTPEFHDKWDRIGSGEVAILSSEEEPIAVGTR